MENNFATLPIWGFYCLQRRFFQREIYSFVIHFKLRHKTLCKMYTFVFYTKSYKNIIHIAFTMWMNKINLVTLFLAHPTIRN